MTRNTLAYQRRHDGSHWPSEAGPRRLAPVFIGARPGLRLVVILAFTASPVIGSLVAKALSSAEGPRAELRRRGRRCDRGRVHDGNRSDLLIAGCR
jgi:hypothetical protein